MQWQIQGRGPTGGVPLLFLDKTEARIPWVPEAFHAWFPVSVKCEKVTRAAADEMKLPDARKKKPLVPRVRPVG